jgi:hypothetical protein
VNGRCPYVAFPPGGDCADGQGNTGELVENETPFVWNDNLCGGSNATDRYSEVFALHANTLVDRIELVVDGSGPEQRVTVNPCVIVTQSP